MNSIFMVHSVTAVSTISKVSRDHERGANASSQKENTSAGTSFSQILEQEVGQVRTDSLSCQNVTYGIDRRLHYFNYRAREYSY